MRSLLLFPILALLVTACSSVEKKSHWPNGAQLVVSVSMQFESGGQPDGAESPFSAIPIPGYPDLPAKSWFRYGYNEGIYRMLDLWDEHNIKVTSHIVGLAAKRNPQIVKEIFNRGHEAASHGMSWASQHNMKFAKENDFVKSGVKAVKDLTGVSPVGYNSYWLRRSKNTLKVLQKNGFLYHIDDISRDEPFVSLVNGKRFVTIPYTLRNNDIALIEGRHFSANDFLEQLKMEFKRLYKESPKRRRMMSVSLHDRIGGTPAIVQAMSEFIKFAKSHKGVMFMRKDKIAKMIINDSETPLDKSENKFNINH